MIPVVEISDSLAALERAAAAHVVESVQSAVRERGVCIVSLAGGSTPRGVYRRLAAPEIATRIDWTRVHLLFGDERMVPPEHADSNYGMVREELLSRIPLPAAQVHRIRGEAHADVAAAEYSRELYNIFRGATDRIDLALLGLGEDGHTASLFPGADALEETEQQARAVYVPRMRAWRVSLTLPVLNRARQALFLVTGAGKAAMVARIVTARQGTAALPATMIRPDSGRVLWMLDADAAAGLDVSAPQRMMEH